ncbi:hypothetical protein [Nocardioides sp. SYSU DS0663]|uniref:hypothetical protein n=1 Tax=Nocardioides sp. SYSU DS0663 TaxID=3416445 RepID=UPI003F4BD22F
MGGAAVGLLGKLLEARAHSPAHRHAQGRDRALDEVPLWLTVVSGVAGVLLGDWGYTRFWDAYTPGLDWWRHVWQLGTAAGLVLLAATAWSGRRHPR